MYIKTSDLPKLNLGFRDYECNWGIHIAGLYETEEERDEIIMSFLGEGAVQGDLQLYCPSEQTEENFIDTFSKSCPHCKEALNNKEFFQIFSTKELYYPSGVFSPLDMDIGLNKLYAESQKKRPRNIRVTAEMVWALEAIPGKEHLMAYESRLNYFIPGKCWISICLYNISKFSGSVIMDVLRTHPYMISKGVLTENPYYVEPDKWLKDNAPQFLTENIYS